MNTQSETLPRTMPITVPRTVSVMHIPLENTDKADGSVKDDCRNLWVS